MAKTTILIVDRSVEDRERLRALLTLLATEDGHEIELYETDDGGEAIGLANKHKVDLVLLEVLIEGPNGLQVMRRLRKDKPKHAPPYVFLVTRMSAEIDRFWGLRNGAHAYVKKPWSEEALRERLKKFLSARQLEPRD